MRQDYKTIHPTTSSSTRFEMGTSRIQENPLMLITLSLYTECPTFPSLLPVTRHKRHPESWVLIIADARIDPEQQRDDPVNLWIKLLLRSTQGGPTT